MQTLRRFLTGVVLTGAALGVSSPASASPLLMMSGGLSSSLMMLISTGNLCIVYDYDANGNRTSQSSFTFGSPGTVWGSGTFGCFNWTL